MTQSQRADLPAPRLSVRRKLRVLGTKITLLEQIRERAEADLGFDVAFEVLDFPSCQRMAALAPDTYDVYDQCFHNLDIVWFWGSLQAIDTKRIADWDLISGLTREGGISRYSWHGRGDAPVRKLYVQPGEFLDSEPARYISMLPTVHNLDSFGYDTRIFGKPEHHRESWSWLFDQRAKGRIALVDEPAIGLFDAALAAEAAGEVQFEDIGNMSVAEVDRLMMFLNERKQEGYFCGVWSNSEEASRLVRDDRASVQSMWSPAYGDLGESAGAFCEAAPIEGYRAWHGGASLAKHLSGTTLDMAYDYLNWWLSGWPGAVMARQGYYMSSLDRVRESLSAGEWAYWYEGAPAAGNLVGPNGTVVVKAGARRAGGSYWERANRIAVWNTTMDEHNYAARAWDRFAASLRLRAS